MVVESYNLMNSLKFVEPRLGCGQLLPCGGGHETKLCINVCLLFFIVEIVPFKTGELISVFPFELSIELNPIRGRL
jgi:hypothetical protein